MPSSIISSAMRLNLARRYRLRHWGLGVGVAVLAGTALMGPAGRGPSRLGAAAAPSVSPTPSHQGVPPPGDPAKSLPPSPDFLLSCDEGNDGTACNSLVLQAIAHARQTREKM